MTISDLKNHKKLTRDLKPHRTACKGILSLSTNQSTRKTCFFFLIFWRFFFYSNVNFECILDTPSRACFLKKQSRIISKSFSKNQAIFFQVKFSDEPNFTYNILIYYEPRYKLASWDRIGSQIFEPLNYWTIPISYLRCGPSPPLSELTITVITIYSALLTK